MGDPINKLSVYSVVSCVDFAFPTTYLYSVDSRILLLYPPF